MKKILFAFALLSAPALAQLSLEQVDHALAIARLSSANEISLKEQRIARMIKENAEIRSEIERLKKAAAACGSKEAGG